MNYNVILFLPLFIFIHMNCPLRARKPDYGYMNNVTDNVIIIKLYRTEDSNKGEMWQLCKKWLIL